jgi:hypothetical protein
VWPETQGRHCCSWQGASTAAAAAAAAACILCFLYQACLQPQLPLLLLLQQWLLV